MANPNQPQFVTNSSQATITLQQMLDKVLPLGDVRPVLNDVGGYQLEPYVTICEDVYTDIIGTPFPHPWNEINLPQFYSNSFQQDYVLLNPDGTSFFNIEWLQRGIVVQMTDSTLPQPWGYVECGRSQTQVTGTLVQPGTWNNNPTFVANKIYNYQQYFGTWGANPGGGTGTLGNNPGPGSVYTNPLTAAQQPANPITQLRDTNGNLQVLTQYGTTGQTQPVWPATGAPPGTKTQDGSVIWTVADPYGWGVRIIPAPSQTGVVFQFNLVGQMPALQFTSLGQTLAPFPDKYNRYFREGVIAQCYKYSNDPKVRAKFPEAYQLWIKSLNDLRAVQDRELEEYEFVPERGIMSAGYRRSTYIGGAWPFQYPY